MKRKKVVVVSNSSWSIFNYRLNLIKSLIKNDFEVSLIAPSDEYYSKLKDEGYQIYEIFMNNKGINPIDDLRIIFELANLYKRIRPDVVLHFTIKPNIYGTIASNFLNIPAVNNITGLGTIFIKDNLITKVVKVLYKLSFSHAAKVFFQNKDDYNLFVQENLVDKNICEVIPGSGIDVEKFKPVRSKKRDNVVKFLLISRMLWVKGVGEYVRAAQIIKQKYSNVEFQLLGFTDVDNPTAISKAQINEWTKAGYVTYLGYATDVRDFIAKADCVVLPSYREGAPRSLLESASMGKPIITTNVPGCKEIVEHGVNGLLCNVRDVRDLADKIEKMINLSKKERDLMGKKGREKILKEFDERIVINKYLKTIKRISKESFYNKRKCFKKKLFSWF